MDIQFSSNKPYLFRAIYEWLLDNGATPYILVDATYPGVMVPSEHVKEGQIVLNIDPNAIGGWHADNDWITFSARFGGVARTIEVPVNAVLAIYAQENGLGMAFPAQEAPAEPESEPNSKSEPEAAQKPEAQTDSGRDKKTSHLKVVK